MLPEWLDIGIWCIRASFVMASTSRRTANHWDTSGIERQAFKPRRHYPMLQEVQEAFVETAE